jgi:hypothetical protein
MRAREFLLEYDRTKTINAFGNKFYQTINNDNTFREKSSDPQKNINAVFSKMEETDPTPNNQYVRWIATQYNAQLVKYEDICELPRPKGRGFLLI